MRVPGLTAFLLITMTTAGFGQNSAVQLGNGPNDRLLIIPRR
jgi:hypothetical protein